MDSLVHAKQEIQNFQDDSLDAIWIPTLDYKDELILEYKWRKEADLTAELKRFEDTIEWVLENLFSLRKTINWLYQDIQYWYSPDDNSPHVVGMREDYMTLMKEISDFESNVKYIQYETYLKQE